MIGMKSLGVGADPTPYAGRYVEGLTREASPGRLPAKGDLVKISKFPQLFQAIGHVYTSGSYAGNGNEGGFFRLPNPGGNFLKPVKAKSALGKKNVDSMVPHSHSVSISSASHGSHHLTGLSGTSPYYYSHCYEVTPESPLTRMGFLQTRSSTTNTSGSHSHNYYISDYLGGETRPWAFHAPLYLISGQTSDVAVAIVYSDDFQVTPGYNESVPTIDGIIDRLALENYHTYRLRFPEATASIKTVDTAHVELLRQLKLLKERYGKVYVLAIGAGALIAARALSIYERIVQVSKFAGINGIYDPTQTFGSSVNTGLSRYLGGLTAPLRASAVPEAPYYRAKCWHGKNNTMVPTSQSENWCEDTVLVDNLPFGANPLTYGVLEQVITFFEQD